MAFKASLKGLTKAVEDTLSGKVAATRPLSDQMQLGEAQAPAQAMPEASRTIRVTQGHIHLSLKSKSPYSATHNPIALAIVTELQRPELYVGIWPDGKVRIGKSCYPLPPEAVAADTDWVAGNGMQPFEFQLPRTKVPC